MSEPEKIGQPITKSIIGKIILDPVDRQPGKLSHLKTVWELEQVLASVAALQPLRLPLYL